MPLGAYIARHRRDAFDVLVLDEVQDYKADGSAQGIIAGQLAAAIPQVLALTGTLYGGVASSLFHLLYRLDPVTREEFAYSDLARWIETYGLYEITEKETEQDGEEIGHVTRRKTNRTTTRREIPGLMPQLIARLARHTVFLRLADVAPDLPPYEEHVTSVAMLPAQQRAYDRLKGDLLAALKEALVKGSKRLLGAYLQSILAYPDAPYREEVVTDPKDDRVIARAPALDEDVVYPKEQTLLDLIARELGQRRKVLVYVQHTGSRDITARLVRLLAERHVKAVVLHSSVEAKTREAWVEARLKEGVQVLITHPKCVQTGLDLLAFPTLVFYQCEYQRLCRGAGVAAQLAHRPAPRRPCPPRRLRQQRPGERAAPGGAQAESSQTRRWGSGRGRAGRAGRDGRAAQGTGALAGGRGERRDGGGGERRGTAGAGPRRRAGRH